jgi:hypothetical protein
MRSSRIGGVSTLHPKGAWRARQSRATVKRMIQKLVLAGIVLLAGIWFAGDLAKSPLEDAKQAIGAAQDAGSGRTVAPPKLDGPNYLPDPKLPDPVDSRGIIDPRDFRPNGMPYPGDPADPGFCSAPGSGLPCDRPTP